MNDVSNASPSKEGRPTSDRLAPFRLTEEQRTIAESPYTSKQVVLAGPGTGKTHVVAARLTHLVLVQGLKPHSQVTLLSYTRVAAHEMRQRLLSAGRQLHTRALDTVEIRTMDSYAYLLHDATDVPRPSGGFEAGMESAVRLLSNVGDAQEAVAELKHVIVDEAQDLYGVRDRFVRSLLSRCGGGFTVCADPNQAIYDYLLLEEEKPGDSGWDSLFAWLKETEKVPVRELHGSKRHKGAVAAMVRRAESHLNEPGVDWVKKWVSLNDLLSETETVERPRLRSALKEIPGTTAILTRTNGEALAMSEFLSDSDEPIPHLLAGAPSPFHVPGWIGRLLPQLPERFGEDTVRDAWERVIGGPAGSVPDGGSAFRLISPLGSRDGSQLLELARVVARIRRPQTLSPELTSGGWLSSPLVVSTVHRAKGREFDNVFFAKPQSNTNVGSESRTLLPMEVRVLYVAMSRPKSRLNLVSAGGGATTIDDGAGHEKRWYVRAWNPALPAKIELRPDDINPWGAIPRGTAVQVQDRLWEMRGRTDLQARAAGRRHPEWELLDTGPRADRTVVGAFSAEFDRAVRTVSQSVWRDPDAGRNLTRIWMEDVATFTLPDEAPWSPLADASFAARGYWLVPVLRGLGLLWGRRRRRGWRG